MQVVLAAERRGGVHGADGAGRRFRRRRRRTKAVKQDDGSWHIEGVKRFITSGGSDDMFENIFHLVLARPGVRPGTKGLFTLRPEVPLRLRDRANSASVTVSS